MNCDPENFSCIELLRVIILSIYTLSDLGDLSNLIRSLSRTIQQYLPPSEWIRASGKAGIRNPESGIGTGIATGTGTGTGIGTGMGRETYIKAGTTFTLI